MRDAMAEINKVNAKTKAVLPSKDFLTEKQKKKNERLLVTVKELEEEGAKSKNSMTDRMGIKEKFFMRISNTVGF